MCRSATSHSMTTVMRQRWPFDAPSACSRGPLAHRSHRPSDRHSKITPHTLLRWYQARSNAAPALSKLGGAAFHLAPETNSGFSSGHLPRDTPCPEYIPEPGVVGAVHDQQW